MPYSSLHRKSKGRVSQRKHRGEPFQMCPCRLCLNRVKLKESDVEKHIARFGIENKTLSCGDNKRKEVQEISPISSVNSLSADEMGATVQAGHSKAGCSWQEMEPPLKQPKISSADENSSMKSVFQRMASPFQDFASADHPNVISSSSNVSTDSSVVSENTIYSEKANENVSAFNSFVSSGDESESIDAEIFHEQPGYLQALTNEEELYSSDKANLPLFEGSTVNVLQALCGYFSWFTGHPGTSKSALSDLLRLHHREILPRGNNLPSSYEEAFSFIKPFLLPFITYHACPNDCVLFRKTDRYDHSRLKRCPVCNESRFISKGKPCRKFYYYPLEPRWRRMYGNANIAEVLQSHCGGDSESLLQDVIGSRSWQSVYGETGFFQGDSRGLSLQFSTDGVNPFSGNKVVYSMWPVMLTVLNLPKRLRNLFSNMLLVGIIPGNGGHEPKAVDPYLEVVVDELLTLSGSQFYDAFRKAPFTFKVQVLNYVLDYPGLNKVFSAVGANALQGCMWCEMRGKHVPGLNKVVYLENRRYLSEDHELRQDCENFPDHKVDVHPPPEQISNMDIFWSSVAHGRAKNATQAANVAKATGSKGCHCFMLLPQFDRINQVFPDMMHLLKNVLSEFHFLFTGSGDSKKVRTTEKELGRFPDSWLDEQADKQPAEHEPSGNKRKPKSNKSKKRKPANLPAAPFRLSQSDLKIADMRAKNVCVPPAYGWKPKCFFSKKTYMKSHDWKQVAIDGIMKFCLRGLLGDKQRQTFFKFLDVLALLCQNSISADSLPVLDMEVKLVLALIERDFPISVQTISLHLLHHIVQGIQEQGPVHSWSMYVYERFNSWISQRVMNRLHPETTVMETYRIFDWVQYMHHSGRLSADDDKQQYILIDEEDIAADVGKQQPPRSSMQKGNEYQLTARELTFCKKNIDSFKFTQSKEVSDEGWLIKRVFTSERRNKTTGKLELWRGHPANTRTDGTISSVVRIKSGPTCVGRVGQVRHFISLQNKSEIIEFVPVDLYVSSVKTDKESGLHYIDARKMEEKVFSSVNISKQMVTATDDEKPHVMWILNSRNV